MLTVASSSWLISIAKRQQVAQIYGKPVYVITGIALIPLSSQKEAAESIARTKEGLVKTGDARKAGDASGEETDDTLTDTDNEDEEAGVEEDDLRSTTTQESLQSVEKKSEQEQSQRTSVAEDVISRRGNYGRFAERWFSKKGWTKERRQSQGMSASDLSKSTAQATAGAGDNAPTEQAADGGSTNDALQSKTEAEGADLTRAESTEIQKLDEKSADAADVTNTLLPKLLRTTRMMLESGSFFFSYDHNLFRRNGSRDTRSTDIPLYRQADPSFFWNRHLSSELIDGGHHGYVLPVLQGFVGQQAFSVASEAEDRQTTGESPQSIELSDVGQTKPIEQNDSGKLKAGNGRSFLITLISRRSVKRSGLRYLRRGIDDGGNAANYVETEQILSSPTWSPSEKIYSFVQIRGSIPLYFTQSPYAFKPIPILNRSHDTNQIAFKKHFRQVIRDYGKVQAVVLVDKHGNEVSIGEAYENYTKEINESGGVDGKKIDFEWFDFHKECAGMKFENVSHLTDTLGHKLNEFDITVESGDEILRRQQGVARTNCMDCLDRTNVVQSAFGQRALEKQLQEEGLTLNLQSDPSTSWFNSLWADNGDAISKQYSSTAALKGDFTRTRKRNYRGMLNDFGLTLSRYYTNIVNDYFSQAAIDYLLGNVTSRVFEEFESDMMSKDPAISMRSVRQNAIDTSYKRVVGDQSEDLIGGWTMLCPHEPNTLRSSPFEEAVLLLTESALYCCRFDWDTEKVNFFERVDLRSIINIRHGIYVTSTLTTTQMDEQRNVGFVVTYKPGEGDLQRVNTRSLQNEPETADTTSKNLPNRILAFKALPADSSVVEDEKGEAGHKELSETEAVQYVCDELARAVTDVALKSEERAKAEDKTLVEEADIITLAEAKKSTGLLEHLGYSLKRLVWA